MIGLALLSGGMLMAGPVPELRAATPATLDILPGDGNAPPGDTIGSPKPLARPNQEGGKPVPSGNPLWAVPLSVLTATQERPIFSPSRHPPPRAAVAPVDRNPPAPPKAAEPEHPLLTLVGTVLGEDEAIAVFLDRTNQKAVRLRQGETHDGWTLSSVLPREATLKKADRAEVLALHHDDAPPGVPGTPGPPGVVAPAAGGFNTSYAPFVPRSTPKNGEPDGL
jgi:general secretion pathway protein N